MKWLLSFFFASLLSCYAAEPASSELYHSHTYFSFQKFAPAQKPLDLGNLNSNLLSAAVFHETNFRRQQEGQPPLAYHPGAHRAASLQSTIMARRGSISHVNPELPRLKTMQDRVNKAGLNPRFAAENVATAFNLKYQSGRSYYTRSENGRTTISYKPNGEPIPPHTYLTYAEALVESWMNSPGHRKNILHPAAKTLGAACTPAPGKKDSPLQTLYCTQIFYTPL